MLRKKKVFPEYPVYSMECGLLMGALAYRTDTVVPSYIFIPNEHTGFGPAFLRNIAEMIADMNRKHGVQ